jgi:hypothetical protein
MKKLAGRDFEDILQCAMPAFEGLMPPEHNEIMLDLLFDLATWHACAKLRLHTPQTIDLLDKTTTGLGQSMRRFAKDTCPEFRMKELAKEQAARA